jgi:RNA polymerase sigma-70 factor (ECF subfamily)
LNLTQELTKGFAGRYIRHKALQLVGIAGFTRSDLPDLQQDLALCLLERLPKFNPARGSWQAFVVTIVERRVATLLMARHAARRAHLRFRLALPTSAEAAVVRCPAPPPLRSELDLVDLEHDVAVVDGRLPYKLRIVCRWLKEAEVPAIARWLGVSQTTIHNRIKTLRIVLLRAGLKNSGKNYWCAGARDQ